MTVMLARDAPLYEATLSVSLVSDSDGASHVEGERLLTVRLLEGSRPMGGGGGGAGAAPFRAQERVIFGAAASPSKGSAPEASSGREKLLHLELCDAGDPYFLFSLDVGEGDFHALRREHALLVDFLAFPEHFVDLLEKCERGGSGGESTFEARLERTGSGGQAAFAVVEANRFKRVTHVALAVAAGDDAAVKALLAGRLGQAQREAKVLEASLASSTAALAAEEARAAASASEARGLEDRLRRAEAAATSDVATVEAEHREAAAAKVEALVKAHASELRSARARADAGGDALRASLEGAEAGRVTAERRGADLAEKLAVE